MRAPNSLAGVHCLDSIASMLNVTPGAASKKKREREDVPSLTRKDGMIGATSVGNDGRDDYDFGFFVVLRKFDFNAALGELTSREIAISPHLVEEVMTAHAMEHQLGFRRTRRF